MIKSRKRWDYIALMGERRVLVGRLRERDHLGKIMLKWIFKKLNEGAWTGLIWLRIGTGGRHL